MPAVLIKIRVVSLVRDNKTELARGSLDPSGFQKVDERSTGQQINESFDPEILWGCGDDLIHTIFQS